jgi:protein-disulfide isomerase
MSSRVGTALAAACVIPLMIACQAEPPGADSASSESPEGAEIAAEVDGEAITVAELDEWIRNDLFEAKARGGASKLYQLRSSALDRILEERVIDAAAKRRGISNSEVLRLEIEELGPVSDEEVEAFFAENKSRLGESTLEKLSPQIRRFIESQRTTTAKANLREEAKVVTHLEPPRYKITAEGPSKGPADAAVTIVEFSDFQCPYCQRALPTLNDVLEKYPGKVRVVYRHLPLDRIHKRARPAAEAAACAEDQQQFWPYHDKLFANNRALEKEDLIRYASEVGLDDARFAECIDERTFQAKVEADLQAAQTAGISGTPAFVVNGVLLSGARPPADFYRIIDAELQRIAKESS